MISVYNRFAVLFKMMCMFFFTVVLVCVTLRKKYSFFPFCDLCNARDVQDEQHVLFHCTHPHVVSLQGTYASLFSSAGLNNVSAFLGQENNKLHFFLHGLIVFYVQASSRTS